MTTAEVTTAAPPPTSARPRFRRRAMWLPVAVALALIVFTLVAVWVRAPAPGGADFLSPSASGGDGAAMLAERLADQGVDVKRYTDPNEAFTAAKAGDTTVFVPAPDFLNQENLTGLSEALKASGNRFVFVDPPREFLSMMGLTLAAAARVAPKTVEPGAECGLSEADEAGAASMLRQAYAESEFGGSFPVETDWRFCYQAGLAWAEPGGLPLTVAGAPEVFTDEYLGQAGNAELATGLLGQRDTVVWLDNHSLAPQPSSPPPSDLPSTPSGEPSRYPIDYPGEARTDPIYEAMPSWLWASLVGVLLLGLLTALWKGKRLGPPVTEPLPVTVPGAETVQGRARLYRRAHAYHQTLNALRAGALHRIQPVLGLSSQARDSEVVAAVAQRTGWPPQRITEILYSARPDGETQLYEATQAVDALVSAVENASHRETDT